MRQLSGLGVGIVWWPAIDPLCHASEELVQVIEAEPEGFWIPNISAKGLPEFRSVLWNAMRALPQPKLLHGVGAPVGGSCRPPPGHLRTFAREIELIRPEWVSEHLSFSRFTPSTDSNDAVFCGFLLPPAQSREGVVIAAENIRSRRVDLGGVPIAFETGVSYLPPRPGEIPDGEFAAAVADTADCGIVLDLHNLLCNERNGRQSVIDFCGSLELQRVWEIHLAGGEDFWGFRLDAHSGLVEPALMDMAGDLLPSLSGLRAIIFEIMPDYVPMVGLSEIGRQLERLNDLWARRPTLVRRAHGSVCRGSLNRLFAKPLESWDWEMLLGSYVIGQRESEPQAIISDWWQSACPALDLYRRLASEGRASMLVATAPTTIRLLLRKYGSMGTRQVLSKFWVESRPAYTAVDEGRAFLRFISEAEEKLPDVLKAVASDENRITQLLNEV